MKSRPILFKPELLDLICRGEKTQTRRLDRRWLALDVGDVLWCKEKLMRQDADGLTSWAEYARDGRHVEPSPFPWKWQRDWLSPRHMPRAAARIPEAEPECSGLDPPREPAARYDTAEEFGSSRR